MNHYSDHYRRNFMDDRVYRSAPLGGHGLNGMFVDQRAPRYSPSTLYDDRQRTSYFHEGVEHRCNGRSGSPYARAFRGYDDVDSYMGNDELVRSAKHTWQDKPPGGNGKPRGVEVFLAALSQDDT
ncbi:hypothetical protein LTR56_016291 [Elasticomyces elasticus]|nr:hypothetical protein LTR56_016291 [Elasticomyces elasticus]KAK3642853.1 hypothetical protein LTR22_015911 [Elasticomyces elasticus]KAK4920727.1 hypothetical protein LTR49_011803 [Elasticomyces elasticus]KAK5754141.1 hypothetical protein LTS12_015783 [Elasticomyces elasticus]